MQEAPVPKFPVKFVVEGPPHPAEVLKQASVAFEYRVASQAGGSSGRIRRGHRRRRRLGRGRKKTDLSSGVFAVHDAIISLMDSMTEE